MANEDKFEEVDPLPLISGETGKVIPQSEIDKRNADQAATDAFNKANEKNMSTKRGRKKLDAKWSEETQAAIEAEDAAAAEKKAARDATKGLPTRDRGTIRAGRLVGGGRITGITPIGSGGFASDKLQGSYDNDPNVEADDPGPTTTSTEGTFHWDLPADMEGFHWSDAAAMEEWKERQNDAIESAGLGALRAQTSARALMGKSWDSESGDPVSNDSIAEYENDEDVVSASLYNSRNVANSAVRPARKPRQGSSTYTTEEGETVAKPYWTKLWQMHKDYMHRKFMNAHTAAKSSATAMGAAKALDLHDAIFPAGEDGVSRCGNPACENSQKSLAEQHESEWKIYNETPASEIIGGRLLAPKIGDPEGGLRSKALNYLSISQPRERVANFLLHHGGEPGVQSIVNKEVTDFLRAKQLRYDPSALRTNQDPAKSDWREEPDFKTTVGVTSNCVNCGHLQAVNRNVQGGEGDTCNNCGSVVEPHHIYRQEYTVANPAIEEYMNDPKHKVIMDKLSLVDDLNRAKSHPIWGKFVSSSLKIASKIKGAPDKVWYDPSERDVKFSDLSAFYRDELKDPDSIDPRTASKNPDEEDFLFAKSGLKHSRALAADAALARSSRRAEAQLTGNLANIDKGEYTDSSGKVIKRTPKEIENSKALAAASSLRSHVVWVGRALSILGHAARRGAASSIDASNDYRRRTAAKEGRVIDSSTLIKDLPAEGRKRTFAGTTDRITNMILDGANSLARSAGTSTGDQRELSAAAGNAVAHAKALLTGITYSSRKKMVPSSKPTIDTSGVTGSMPGATPRNPTLSPAEPTITGATMPVMPGGLRPAGEVHEEAQAGRQAEFESREGTIDVTQKVNGEFKKTRQPKPTEE